MNDLQQQLETLLTMVTDHNDPETKYSKPQSAKIRASLGDLKKDVTRLRSELVAQDKQN